MVREMGREGEVTGSDSHRLHVQFKQLIVTVRQLMRGYKHQICSSLDNRFTWKGKRDRGGTEAKSNVLLTQSDNELASHHSRVCLLPG